MGNVDVGVLRPRRYRSLDLVFPEQKVIEVIHELLDVERQPPTLIPIKAWTLLLPRARLSLASIQ